MFSGLFFPHEYRKQRLIIANVSAFARLSQYMDTLLGSAVEVRFPVPAIMYVMIGADAPNTCNNRID